MASRTELTYMRAVEVADRLLAMGVPVLGVKSAPDGTAYELFVAGLIEPISFAVETNIMTALSYVQAVVRGENPAVVSV